MFGQQCADEALCNILEIFHKELSVIDYSTVMLVSPDNMLSKLSNKRWKEFVRKEFNSKIIRLFYGQLKITCKCLNCFTETNIFDPYNVYHITPPFKNTLEKCISSNYNEEMIEKHCERCKNNQEHSKTEMLWKTPKYFIIVIKRWVDINRIDKTEVNFPIKGLSINNVNYNLISVINHHGSTQNSGHYTNFSKYNNKWYLLNDESITECHKNNLISGDAFILLYESI